MSIISPTTCGFAKVCAFNIFTGDKISQNIDENLKMYRSREIEHQFNLWQEQFIGYNEQFKVNYEHFKKYDQKIVDNRITCVIWQRNDPDLLIKELLLVMQLFSRKKWNELFPQKKGEHRFI